MFANQTFNALTVLRAMLSGYAVELLGVTFAYDQETRKIGIVSQEGDGRVIMFPDINLNRFLSMCEQMDPEKIQEMLSVLQYSTNESTKLPEDPGFHFH